MNPILSEKPNAEQAEISTMPGIIRDGHYMPAPTHHDDRQWVDVVSVTKHDQYAQIDYELLRQAGVKTIRDGLRWHLIETEPYRYDWSSLFRMLEAASSAGVQLILDLCHWGVPPGLDPFSSEFVSRFSGFAGAAARVVMDYGSASYTVLSPIYCPINEISFWSWVGGDEEHFDPYGNGKGRELKRQLVEASIAAMRAVRGVDPTARFVQAEPIIHISAEEMEDAEGAARHTASQFEAWDMLKGIDAPELGGSEDLLDVIGVNYYWNNQWIHEGDRTPPGHQLHRPLQAMLKEIWDRYRRPIIITETGTEAGAEFGWLGYVSAEVRQAHRLGVPVLGVCLYPAMDYPGWDDDRHCRCGLIELDSTWTHRRLRQNLSDELKVQQASFERSFPCSLQQI